MIATEEWAEGLGMQVDQQSAPLLTWLRSPDPFALVVTAAWPRPEHPSSGIFIRRQVGALARAGFAPDVLVVHGYRGKTAYGRAALALLRESVKTSRRYRLVHAHGGEAAMAARFYLRAPLVISYLGSDLLGVSEAGRARGLEAMLIRTTARFAQKIIVKSEPMHSALPRAVRSRTRVIPSGIDLELFRPEARASARDELGWPLDDRVVLFAADPALPHKRFALAARVCERASELVGSLRLHVAHGVPPEDVPKLMNASDCLLHPSASEGSANVIKEALACNLPVVATPVGDAVERLDGVTPSFVCPPDEELLARAVVACVEPARRSNGRERCGAVSEERVITQITSLYRELAR